MIVLRNTDLKPYFTTVVFLQIPVDFLQSTNSLFQQCASNILSNDNPLRDILCSRLECVLKSLEDAIQNLGGFTCYEEDVQTLHHLRLQARRFHHILVASVNSCSVTSSELSAIRSVASTGLAGRPRFLINIEQIELLRGCNFTWEEIAQISGVSRTTIWRRFKDLGIPSQKYSEVSDQELDGIVLDVQRNNPNIGISCKDMCLAKESLCKETEYVKVYCV